MQKKILVGFVLFFFVVLTGQVNATLIRYDVAGNVGLHNFTNSFDKHEVVNGYISIDDTAILNPDLENESYQITDFNLIFGEFKYTFYGNSGNLLRTDGDEFLSLYGSGDWNCFKFDKNVDNRGIGLPDHMNCGEGWEYGPQCNVILDDGFQLVDQDFDLYRTSPVPEPATMILFSAGLLGIVGFNRKKSFKRLNS